MFLQSKVNSAHYIAQVVNSMLLPFLLQEDDVLFSSTMHVHIWLLQCNVLFVVYSNCPGQQEPQTSHQLNTHGTCLSLWSMDNIIASHLAGLGSIPGLVSFPGWGFFWGYSSTVRQMSGKLRPHPPLDIIGHHNNQKPFITGANDLRCWCTLKHKLQQHMGDDEAGTYSFSRACHNHWQIVTIGARCLG